MSFSNNLRLCHHHHRHQHPHLNTNTIPIPIQHTPYRYENVSFMALWGNRNLSLWLEIVSNDSSSYATNEEFSSASSEMESRLTARAKNDKTAKIKLRPCCYSLPWIRKQAESHRPYHRWSSACQPYRFNQRRFSTRIKTSSAANKLHICTQLSACRAVRVLWAYDLIFCH